MTEAEWFSSENAKCGTHLNSDAEHVCARCGRFVCDQCVTDRGACAACVSAAVSQSLPQLARGIAWKLMLVPVLLLGSSVWLTVRSGHSLSSLEAIVSTFMPWAIPLVCGLRLLVGPSVKTAWIGTIGAMLLLLTYLGPSLLEAPDITRGFEVLLLSAAPLGAVLGTWQLAQARARLEFWSAVA